MRLRKAMFKILNLYSTIWMSSKARVIVRGHDELPPKRRGEKRVYILINHSTTYDAVALFHISKEPFVLMMDKGAFTFPVIRHILSGAGFVPLDKKDSKPAFEACIDAVNEGRPLLISLHEGDSTQGDWGRPRTGGIRLAHITGATLIPLYLKVESDRIRHLRFTGIDGTEYPYTTFKDSLYFVEFLPPVDFSSLPAEPAYEDYFAIAKGLDADRQRIEALYDAYLEENRERFAPMRRRGGTRLRIAW